MTIDIEADVVSLTAALVDIASVSGDEKPIADAVELALRQLDYLHVERDGNVVLARSDAGRSQRIVLAGHLDTVPIADNVPSRRDGDILHGCGSSDMIGANGPLSPSQGPAYCSMLHKKTSQRCSQYLWSMISLIVSESAFARRHSGL